VKNLKISLELSDDYYLIFDGKIVNDTIDHHKIVLIGMKLKGGMDLYSDSDSNSDYDESEAEEEWAFGYSKKKESRKGKAKKRKSINDLDDKGFFDYHWQEESPNE
jgi:hypothetical protein